MSKDIYTTSIEVFHTVYETTNLINGKYYIGKHSTSDPNDDYLGSGTTLNRAVKKYGIENFSKTILAIFNTEQEALDYEEILVTIEFIKSNNNYNLVVGGGCFGSGDNHPLFGKTHSNETKKKMSDSLKGENNPLFGKTHSNETKKKMSEANKGKKSPFFRRTHLEESRKKISDSKKGENHPLFGKNRSEETKKKISETAIKAAKNMPLATCIYCCKTMKLNQLTRFHGDKCKEKDRKSIKCCHTTDQTYFILSQ